MIDGDARETLARLSGPFDRVWIDAWKADYLRDLDAVLPKLAPRRIIVAKSLFRRCNASPRETPGLRWHGARLAVICNVG